MKRFIKFGSGKSKPIESKREVFSVALDILCPRFIALKIAQIRRLFSNDVGLWLNRCVDVTKAISNLYDAFM